MAVCLRVEWLFADCVAEGVVAVVAEAGGWCIVVNARVCLVMRKAVVRMLVAEVMLASRVRHLASNLRCCMLCTGMTVAMGFTRSDGIVRSVVLKGTRTNFQTTGFRDGIVVLLWARALSGSLSGVSGLVVCSCVVMGGCVRASETFLVAVVVPRQDVPMVGVARCSVRLMAVLKSRNASSVSSGSVSRMARMEGVWFGNAVVWSNCNCLRTSRPVRMEAIVRSC